MAEWKSILVESGVHVKGTVPAHVLTVIRKGIKEAVDWALQSEDWSEAGRGLECDLGGRGE
jgi:hypothetical protein